MKIYFLSSQPCALFLNELYFGITDHFERFVDVALSDKIYVRFAPQDKLPIGFFIDNTLPTTPPIGCEIYLLRDGIAIYAKDFPAHDFSLKLIAQQRVNDTLATLFCQGEIQLSIESSKGYFNATLPTTFANAELFLQGDLCFIHTQEWLAVYTKRCERLLLEQITDFSVQENILNATLPLSDRLKRSARCQWTLTENSCTQTKFILQEQNDTPSEELLAYAFFESLLIGANVEGFLSEALQSKASQIKEFIGEFISVSPTETPNTCALIKRKQERVFEAVYYTVIIENGKIIDVQG